MFKSILGLIILLWLLYNLIKDRCIISAIITLVLIMIIILSMITEFLNRIPFYLQVTIIVILGISLIVSYTQESNEK